MIIFVGFFFDITVKYVIGGWPCRKPSHPFRDNLFPLEILSRVQDADLGCRWVMGAEAH